MSPKQPKAIEKTSPAALLLDLRDIITRGRALAYAAAGTVMIDTYWEVEPTHRRGGAEGQQARGIRDAAACGIVQTTSGRIWQRL